MDSFPRALGRLVRLPNLLTVPGDSWAGLFLALAACTGTAGGVTAWGVATLALASVAAYAGGMVDNDLTGVESDRVERPERPLPSGSVPIPTARRIRTVLLSLPFVLGLAVRLPPAWVAVHAALLVCILAYNRLKERFRAGLLLMGLCRGLSLLSGAALTGVAGMRSWGVLLATGVWVFWITGVTAFAAQENRQGAGPLRYFLLLPHLLAVAAGAILHLRLLPGGLAILAAGGAGLVLAAHALTQCGSRAEPALTRSTVGRLVRSLIPMQSMACLASGVPGSLPAGALLVMFWVLSDRWARRYAAS